MNLLDLDEFEFDIVDELLDKHIRPSKIKLAVSEDGIYFDLVKDICFAYNDDSAYLVFSKKPCVRD